MDAGADVARHGLQRLDAALASGGERPPTQREPRAHVVGHAEREALDPNAGRLASAAAALASADEPREERPRTAAPAGALHARIGGRERLEWTGERCRQKLRDLAAAPPPGGADTEVGDDRAARRPNRPATPASLRRSLALVPDRQPGPALATRGIGDVVVGGPREDRVLVEGAKCRVADCRAIDPGARRRRRAQRQRGHGEKGGDGSYRAVHRSGLPWSLVNARSRIPRAGPPGSPRPPATSRPEGRASSSRRGRGPVGRR